MRLKITPKDINHLRGRYIVLLTESQEDEDITKGNFHFWDEKRIRVVGFGKKVTLLGRFYGETFESLDEFVEHFNKPSPKRFYRLLTKRELDWYLQNVEDGTK